MSEALTIEGELTDLNTYINAERSNRFIGAKLKKENTEKVIAAIKKQNFKIIGHKTEVHFYWYSKNHRKDFDNIEFSQKFIWDGLVRAGVLKDDNQINTPARRIHNHIIEKDAPRIVIYFH
jgi:Holliday junction resolvase RusA-like endonuclease